MKDYDFKTVQDLFVFDRKLRRYFLGLDDISSQEREHVFLKRGFFRLLQKLLFRNHSYFSLDDLPRSFPLDKSETRLLRRLFDLLGECSFEGLPLDFSRSEFSFRRGKVSRTEAYGKFLKFALLVEDLVAPKGDEILFWEVVPSLEMFLCSVSFLHGRSLQGGENLHGFPAPWVHSVVHNIKVGEDASSHAPIQIADLLLATREAAQHEQQKKEGAR